MQLRNADDSPTLGGENELFTTGYTKDLQISYYLYDHLGNTRIVFHTTYDCKNLEYVAEYVADYYPFGKILREWTPCEVERYLTTQHERDKESGYDYRGARFYDADLGRFLSVDPLAHTYPSWSPYSYAESNPILYTDPTGRSIEIYWQEYRKDDDGNYKFDRNGQKILDSGYITYSPGMAKTGIKFVDEVITSLNWLIDKGADVNGIICDLATNSENTLIIKADNRINNPAFDVPWMRSYFATKGLSDEGPGLIFNPYRAHQSHSNETPSIFNRVFGDWAYRTPAEILLHELGHAQSYFSNPSLHKLDTESKVSRYHTKEERDVILNVENPAARILRPNAARTDRTHHSGEFYKVDSPIQID